MSKLSRKLEELGRIERVVAECGECGKTLFDSHESKYRKPSMVSKLIKNFALAHRSKAGHDDLDVEIDQAPKVKREIDCTVTVNR